MPVKATTQALIDSLLKTVPFEINYKDDIFLQETIQYNHLVSSCIGSKDNNSKNYNPNYDVLLAEKKNITFTDVKFDLINSVGKDRLEELEDNYIWNCKKLGDAADKVFHISFQDNIADKFDCFIREVAKKRDNRTISIECLERVNHNMKLVYKDGIKPPYQFSTLDALLDEIAKSIVCYCNGVRSLNRINKIPHSSSKGSRNKTTPLFIRRVCAMICYTLLDFGNFVSIQIMGKQIGTNTGVTKQIMSDLHQRCVKMGYAYFTIENKLFQYDKWSISPEEMLRKWGYIPPKAPITYAGIKQGWLGFLISELQNQVVHNVFMDVFGGSGMSIIQFKHNEDVRYLINDFHCANVCYYKVLKAPDKEFKEFLKCLEAIRETVKIAVSKENNGTWTRDEFNIAIGRLFNIYDTVADACIDTEKRNYVLFGTVCSDFFTAMKNIDGNFKQYKYKPYIIIAAIFTAFSNMTVNGSIDKYIIGSANSFISKNINQFEKEFESLREIYSDIEIVSDFGANAIDLIGNYGDTALIYLDSPYIGTTEYNASKNSSNIDYSDGTIISEEDFGKKFISSDFNMADLLDKCDNFKGKIMFSCRLNMPNSEPMRVITGCFTTEIDKKDSNIIKYKKYNQNEIYHSLSNYLWFFNRWLKMKDIDRYYAYCMIDTDFNLMQRDLYYNSSAEKDKYWQKPEDKSLKKEFINADWGMDIETNMKEKIFDYLRAVILLSKNFEMIITNYDAKVPRFKDMYEYIFNDYNKSTENITLKNKKDGSVKDSKNMEILIPENGMFVKIPMKLIAQLVLTEFKDIKKSFVIKS